MTEPEHLELADGAAQSFRRPDLDPRRHDEAPGTNTPSVVAIAPGESVVRGSVVQTLDGDSPASGSDEVAQQFVACEIWDERADSDRSG